MEERRLKDYRRCVSCRRVAPKSAFWRIVRCHPDQQVRLDQGMGRSVYLCPHLACLKVAQKKDRLSRSLKTKVDAALYHRLEKRLVVAERPDSAADLETAPIDVTPID
jgi:uncharacterized protein